MKQILREDYFVIRQNQHIPWKSLLQRDIEGRFSHGRSIRWGGICSRTASPGETFQAMGTLFLGRLYFVTPARKIDQQHAYWQVICAHVYKSVLLELSSRQNIEI